MFEEVVYENHVLIAMYDFMQECVEDPDNTYFTIRGRRMSYSELYQNVLDKTLIGELFYNSFKDMCSSQLEEIVKKP